MRIKKNNKAVSEIIGSILLLAMAVAIISVVYTHVLSEPGPGEKTFVTIVGKMEGGNVAFENQRGETLDPGSQIMLTIAGQQKPTITLANEWNIGEKLYPVSNLGDLTGVQIDATIIDSNSKSMVFWGRLQEGYVVPPSGRGGLWHFNESSWNGTPGEVKDSSGNDNNGTAYNGANTINSNLSAAANRSGRFDGIDDYVEVKNAYSLAITDQITMEAWIYPFNFNVSGVDRLANQFGFTPYITHVSEKLFAIVSEDQGKKGMIQTVNITPYGQLELTGNKIEDFGRSKSERNLRPIITNVVNDVYLIAYIDDDLHVHLKTFNISSPDGFIEYTGKELVFSDTPSVNNVPDRPSIIKVSNDIFAIAYWSNPSVGIIKTVNISSDGTITYTGHMSNFDATQGYEPSIIHVAGDVFAIAYRGPSNNGLIKTFNIYSDGTIVYTGNMLKFDDTGFEPSIVNVAGNVFAIAYRGPSNNGLIKTFNIYSDGTISIIGTNNFESSSCYDPCIISQSQNHYIIAYATANSGDDLGLYKTIEIPDSGTVTSIGSVTPFDQQRCYNPIAIKITDRVFAIVYEGKVPGGGSGHPGNLITALAEYPSYIYSAGICKYGSYGMYANTTKVFVNINTITINASIIPDAWNYVALTYDRNQMKLYTNGALRQTKLLTEPIKITDSNLLFGDLFYGLIDEVAIYDRALSNGDILNHFNYFKGISTSVDAISSPVTSSPHTITATGDSALDNVTLWYRWSDDNSSWDGGLKEVNDSVDNNDSNVDGNADIGTETNFTNAQDIAPDTDTMDIQEVDSVATPVNEWLNCNALGTTYTGWTTVGTTPYINAQDQPTNYVHTSTNNAQIGWFDFPSTTLTGTVMVNISIYCHNVDGANNDGADIFVDYTGSGSGVFVGTIGQHTTWQYDTINLGMRTISEVNSLRVYLKYNGVGPKNDVAVDHIRIGVSTVPNYQIDFEYQWTAAHYNMDNKQVCIYVTSHTGTENLNVSYWTGSAWSSLGTITGTGWSNFTAQGLTSQTYTIQLKGATETGDTSQDTWNIDAIMLHTWNNSGVSHGHDWISWSNAGNPDTSAPWSWNFNFPDGAGYYEFYSIGKHGGDIETAPLSADATCFFNPP